MDDNAMHTKIIKCLMQKKRENDNRLHATIYSINTIDTVYNKNAQ